MSWEEFLDNLCLRYGLIPQDIPATCDGCGNKFSVDHALSCPKGGLVLAQHDDVAKDWGALGAWALVLSAITYEPKINSRTVQGERTGAGARQEGGEAEGGTDRLVGQPGQVVVPAESRADVSAHGFWKRGITAMFDIRIVNLDAGSYLRMTPEKTLAKAEEEKKDLYLQACLERRKTFPSPLFQERFLASCAGKSPR